MGRLSHIGVEVRLAEYINSMVAAIFMIECFSFCHNWHGFASFSPYI